MEIEKATMAGGANGRFLRPMCRRRLVLFLIRFVGAQDDADGRGSAPAEFVIKPDPQMAEEVRRA